MKEFAPIRLSFITNFLPVHLPLHPMRYTTSFYQVIFPIQIDRSFFGDDQLQKIQDILSIQFACIRWQCGLQIGIANNTYSIINNRFIIFCNRRVTTCSCRNINDHRTISHSLHHFFCNQYRRFFPGICAVVITISALAILSAIFAFCRCKKSSLCSTA